MARIKPYTVTLGVIDVVLLVLTGGFWGIIMIVRELHMRK